MPISPRLLRGSKRFHGSEFSSPTDISNLFAWYEEDYGVYQDTVGGVVAGIGDPVGAWENRAGSPHLTEPSTRPTLQASGVTFDGTDDRLTCGAVTGVTRPFSFFMVAAYGSSITGGKILGNTVDNDQWYTAAPAGPFLIYSAEGLSLPLPLMEREVLYIFSGVFHGVTSVVGVNESESGGNSGSNSLFDGYQLAYTPALIPVFQSCTVRALLMYSARLDSEQRQNVRGYLNSKYGVY